MMNSSILKTVGLGLLTIVVVIIAAITIKDEVARTSSPSIVHGSANLTEADVKLIIKDHLNENPEIIVNAYANYQRQVYNDQQKRAKLVIKDKIDELENDASTPFIGNPNASVTIVEFFDYSCGYCKRVFPDMLKLLETDTDVKIVLKELPILGPNSELASKAALATYLSNPDKYFDVHQAFLKKRITGQTSIIDTLTQLGLDVNTITTAMNSSKVATILSNNKTLATAIGINGTPAFTINGELVSGIIDYAEFVQKVKAARQLAQSNG